MKNKNLEEKASWYYACGNFLAALCALFGIAPAILGLLSNKLDLFYQGLNFFVVSFALIVALRSGYLLSDRDLKRGWIHWLERNKDKVETTDNVTGLIISLIFIALIIRDFYGINGGFVPILKNILLVFKDSIST